MDQLYVYELASVPSKPEDTRHGLSLASGWLKSVTTPNLWSLSFAMDPQQMKIP